MEKASMENNGDEFHPLFHMKVGELVERLKQAPQDAIVVLTCESGYAPLYAVSGEDGNMVFDDQFDVYENSVKYLVITEEMKAAGYTEEADLVDGNLSWPRCVCLHGNLDG